MVVSLSPPLQAADAPPDAAALERAIREGELVLHYQPKVDLLTHGVVGVEALVRWQLPGGRLIFPDDFIPLAEASGLMPALTGNVLVQALDQYVAWRSAGVHLKVAVNVAASLLADPRGVPHVASALSRRGITPSALTLEVTESVVMDDVEAALRTLRDLDQMGVTLSIDDFGIGYSSLAYLSRLPVRELKIDRSFVTTLTSDENHQAIVRSTLGLGHGFGHRVVAEGVEDLATYTLLQRAGCDLVQGYFVSRPLPAERFSEWLSGEWPLRSIELAVAAGGDAATADDGGSADDWAVQRALLRAYEDLVAGDTTAALVAAMSRFVRTVGGGFSGDEGVDDADVLPIDLSLGEGEPLLPAAAPGGRARRHLDRSLPQMVGHGRRMVALLRQGARP